MSLTDGAFMLQLQLSETPCLLTSVQTLSYEDNSELEYTASFSALFVLTL